MLRESSMHNQAAWKVTERWAEAANATSSHARDYFLEALREFLRDKEKGPDDAAPGGGEKK
jgi:hypothetical protein